MVSSTVWTGPVMGCHSRSGSLNQSAVLVLNGRNEGALEVGAFSDSVFDGGAHMLVDACVDPFEPPYLLRVDQPIGRQLLHSRCCDRTLAGGRSALAARPAEVAGLVDELAVDLSSPFPPRCHCRTV